MSIILLLILLILVIVSLAIQGKRTPVYHNLASMNQDFFPEIRVDLGPSGQAVQTGWIDWSGSFLKTFNSPFGSFTATLNPGNNWLDNGELVELDPDSNPSLIKTAKTDLLRDGYATSYENIILTLRGLRPGRYTITLYSCNTAKATTGFWADFKVKLTDASCQDSIILKKQHTYGSDSYQYAAATPFSFTSNGTDEIIITMVRNRGELWLNGFVITPIDLNQIIFSHPMTVINRSEFSVVKELIAKNINPQAFAFQNLIADADEALQFIPDPPANMNIMSSYELGNNLQEMRAWLWKNCHAAYCSALAYAYSGKIDYAEKAVSILNAWAKKATTFYGAECGLQLGSYFTPMLYAADLLTDYSGWNEWDQQDFKEWWRKNCLVHTREVMYSKDNDWKDAGILGVLAAAVVLEDPTLFYEALVELASYSYGDWKLKRNNNTVYLPREVNRNNGRNGITYTNYAFTCLVQAIEIARYAGFNFWNLKTTSGASLKEAVESLFKWDVLGAPFPWNQNP
ncbi:MAG: alginate lyase family protein, partial [Bacteroidota bacterium]